MTPRNIHTLHDQWNSRLAQLILFSKCVRGHADPEHDFRNGARAGGNKVSTGEGFLSVDVVGKGDEVAHLWPTPP